MKKLLKGDRADHYRWEDDKGNFVGWPRLMRNGSRAVWTGMRRILLKKHPPQPWISYDAIARLDGFLNPSSKVLEFGSGNSTAWYAERAGHVYSVEDHRQWHEIVQKSLAAAGRLNVTHQFVDDESAYVKFGDSFDTRFDLIMVDGKYRSACIANSLHLINDGGIIYLDNSDRHSPPGGDDTVRAAKLLTEFAEKHGCEVEYFTDFAPAQFFVQQGMMVRMPHPAKGNTGH